MEEKLNSFEKRQVKEAHLTDVMNLVATRSIESDEDKNMGLLWNLTNLSGCFKMLDGKLVKLNHASRCNN